jgi:hypothetical protein
LKSNVAQTLEEAAVDVAVDEVAVTEEAAEAAMVSEVADEVAAAAAMASEVADEVVAAATVNEVEAEVVAAATVGAEAVDLRDEGKVVGHHPTAVEDLRLIVGAEVDTAEALMMVGKQMEWQDLSTLLAKSPSVTLAVL